MKKIFSTISLIFCCINVFAQVWVINSRITASYDSNATAANNAGSVATQLDRTATTTLCKGLKNFGLFYKYTTIYHMNGGTSTAHAVNLRSVGTYTMTWVGSPTHSSGGVDWNASTQYGNTNIPSSLIVESSTYFSVYHGKNIDELGVSYGYDDGGKHGGMFTKISSQFYDDNPTETNGRIQIATAYDTRAMWGSSQTPTRVHTVYRNGSSIGSNTSSTVGAYTANNIWLNARSPTPDFSGSKITLWFAFAQVGFSSIEVANEYTVVQAYQTMKGRQQ